jgi:antitoxin component of RelBE/YafQ-DinJ toxin-antitoxin module
MGKENLQNEDTAKAGSESPENRPAGDSQTFTQEQVNSLVGQARAQTRAKYAKFDEYKAAYEKLQEIEESSKSDLEKAQARAARAEAELGAIKAEQEVSLLRSQVANEKGVPADLLTARTEEELNAQAEKLLNYAEQKKRPPVVNSDGFAPTTGGAKTTRDVFAQALENLM